ncbi:hypothetical protein N0V85_006980 [Neurospora sp. IMI 360204]|nr:hypothetical protein N0V85_006980 [Neurospora sp. IMI 360204]
MATPNYTPEQISALRSLRHRLRSAKYDWEVRQLLKNTASATGLKQVQLVQWQDGDNNRKNLLHWLVDERLEKVAILLIKVFWDQKEEDQRQLMRIIRYPKCYIDSPQGEGNGEYTVERLAEGRNCEQLVDMVTRFRELYPARADVGEEEEEEEEEEEQDGDEEEERAREETELLHLLLYRYALFNLVLTGINLVPPHLSYHPLPQHQGPQPLHFGIFPQVQSQSQSGKNKEQGRINRFRAPDYLYRVLLCLYGRHHLNLALQFV